MPSLFVQSLFMVPCNLYALLRYIEKSVITLTKPVSVIPLFIMLFMVIPILITLVLLSPILVSILSNFCQDISLRFEDYVDEVL